MAPKKAVVVEFEGPKEGEGNFYYMNGATFSGGWKFNMPAEEEVDAKPVRVRHGKGVYKDGEYTYEGDFLDDAMHGTGTFTFASGASYSGSWQKNKYHGRGKFTWPNGSCYEGDFEQNIMHGSGSYKDAQGRVWSGKFFQGSGPGLTYDLA